MDIYEFYKIRKKRNTAQRLSQLRHEGYITEEEYQALKDMYRNREEGTDEAYYVLEQGHWVLLDKCSNSGYYCSECQKKVVKEGWSDTVKKIKFCPNCGAKMESEDKE